MVSDVHPVIQFVTAPSTDAELLLDLNADDPFYVGADGFSLGGPAFEPNPNGVGAEYTYRTITVPLHIEGTSGMAYTGLGALSRVLVLPSTWLRFQESPNDDPVFARVYASEPQELDWENVYTEEFNGEPLNLEAGQSLYTLSLTLPADPFLLGLREDVVSTVLVYNDPEHGGNAGFLDIPDIKGDYPAPCVIWGPSAGFAEAKAPWIASEPVDSIDPPDTVLYVQAEDFDLVNESTLVDNDPLYSGSGDNAVLVTLGHEDDGGGGTAAAALGRRMNNGDLPGFPRPGAYRVYARCSADIDGDSTVAVPDIDVRVGVGNHSSNARFGPTVRIASNNMTALDLGVVQIGPAGLQGFGYDGAPTGYHPRLFVDVGTPDPEDWEFDDPPKAPYLVTFDYFRLVPVDYTFGRVATDPPNVPADTWTVLDGPNGQAYLIDTDDPFDGEAKVVQTSEVPIPRGGFPLLYPETGSTRLHFQRPAGSVAASQQLSVSYWPRYVHPRPVGG